MSRPPARALPPLALVLLAACGADERARSVGRARFEDARRQYEQSFAQLAPPAPTPRAAAPSPSPSPAGPAASPVDSGPSPIPVWTTPPAIEVASPAPTTPAVALARVTPPVVATPRPLATPPGQRPAPTAPIDPETGLLIEGAPRPGAAERVRPGMTELVDPGTSVGGGELGGSGGEGGGIDQAVQSPTPASGGDPGSDSEPPRITGIQFAPVEVLDGGTVVITVQVTDNLTGPAGGSGSIASPSARVFIPFALSVDAAATGPAASLTGTFRVPPESEMGAWRLTNLRVTDKAQNSAVFTPRDLPLMGQAVLKVSSNRTDTEPPTLESLELSPPRVDDGGTIKVVVRARDAASKIQTIRGILANPSRSVQLNFYPRPASEEGVFEGSVTLPKHSEFGEWVVTLLTLTDSANNRATLLADDQRLAQARVAVSSGSSDVTPPQLQTISLSPSRVQNGGTLEVRVQASDDLSGVKGVDGWVSSPNGKARIPFSLRGTPSGTDFEGRVGIPQGGATGEWRVERLVLSDGSGNRTFLNATDAVLAGALFEVF